MPYRLCCSRAGKAGTKVQGGIEGGQGVYVDLPCFCLTEPHKSPQTAPVQWQHVELCRACTTYLPLIVPSLFCVSCAAVKVFLKTSIASVDGHCTDMLTYIDVRPV